MGSARIIFTICCLLFVAAISAKTCDKSSCPGPTAYYKDINCTAVYDSPDDCCPYRYNCDHLFKQPLEKCYINGHEYEIGEKLREDDQNPCDIGCTCVNNNGVPLFNCAVVDCFYGPVKPGCYRQQTPASCCPGEEVCPEDPDEIPKCIVDGKEYRDGEYFVPSSEPDKFCYCGPDYVGKNEEPFCIVSKNFCRPLFRHRDEVLKNCAPVYYSTQSLNSSCSVFTRCQNKDDKVIKNNAPSKPGLDMTCKFGDLTMNYGDELNQATGYESVCIKCICEVGPVPTCQRLPDEECDVSDHPPFEEDDY